MTNNRLTHEEGNHCLNLAYSRTTEVRDESRQKENIRNKDKLVNLKKDSEDALQHLQEPFNLECLQSAIRQMITELSALPLRHYPSPSNEDGSVLRQLLKLQAPLTALENSVNIDRNELKNQIREEYGKIFEQIKKLSDSDFIYSYSKSGFEIVNNEDDYVMVNNEND